MAYNETAYKKRIALIAGIAIVAIVAAVYALVF